jgi:hypothetical protein
VLQLPIRILYNMWACQNCGRFYTREEIGVRANSRCFLCERVLSQWKEGPDLFFIISGMLLLPLFGYFAVGCVRVLGWSNPIVNTVAYSILPASIFMLGLVKFALGLSWENAVMRREGIQGLLLAFSFFIVTGILWIIGYYRMVMGI